MGFSPLLIGDRFEAYLDRSAGGAARGDVSVPSSSGIGLKPIQMSGMDLGLEVVSVPSSSGIGLKPESLKPCATYWLLRFSPLLIGDRFEAKAELDRQLSKKMFQSPPHRGSV